MAIYRLYPEKDTFISSKITGSNAGRDEILEIASYPQKVIEGHAHRLMVQYKLSEIQDTLNNLATPTFSSSLHFSLADANELDESYSIEAFPLAQSWENGKGKFADVPIDTSGCSWRYRTKNQGSQWSLSTPPAGATGSYSGSATGGGLWYTGSNGIDTKSTQEFPLYSDLDVDIDVTAATKLIHSESISNNGFILKLPDNLEFETTSSTFIKFFGRDTNTIYRPYLEVKWDDSSYDTGSLSVLSTDISTVGLKNNKGEYKNSSKQRFRVTAKPKYPTRTFTTGSIYNNNYALPSGSFYAIKDEFTDEYIVNFDTEFTKISCDSNGGYFDFYMNALQPGRYYKILISSSLDGSETIIDDDNIFKVI